MSCNYLENLSKIHCQRRGLSQQDKRQHGCAESQQHHKHQLLPVHDLIPRPLRNIRSGGGNRNVGRSVSRATTGQPSAKGALHVSQPCERLFSAIVQKENETGGSGMDDVGRVSPGEYRSLSARWRRLAADATTSWTRDHLLKLARQCEFLAGNVDQVRDEIERFDRALDFPAF
jgi:hypothetical protein